MAGEALGTVQGLISESQGWGMSALATAQSALATLGATSYSYLQGIGYGSVGTISNPTIQQPSAPSSLTVGNAPSTINIVLPVRPTRPYVTVPVLQTLKDITVPNLPSISIPTMGNANLGSLLQLSLPQVPSISINDLSISDPVPLSINPHTWSFSVDEILTSDDPLVAACITRLKNNIVNGGTGLTAAIEDAIWARELERNEQQLEDSTDKLVSAWAKLGFSLPDGMLANSLSDLQKEYMNRKIDRAREIGIKQAELEQSNLFKSLEMAVNLAFKLVEANTRYQELVLRCLEDTAKFANEYIDLQIKAHNDIIEVFKARVGAYEVRIRGELAKAEVYKSQIEGAMAAAKMNEATVHVYSAQIDAEIAKYKGVIEADQAIAQIFSAQVQGVLAQAHVNESIVRAYAEKVKGIIATVEIYKAEVEGMTAEIGAEKAKVEANVAQISAWAKGVDAKIAEYSAKVEFYKAQSSHNVSVAEVTSKIGEANIRAQISNAQVAVAAADAIGKSLQAASNTQMEAAKGVAVAAASLASGAMAAMSAHASLAYSESVGYDGGEV